MVGSTSGCLAIVDGAKVTVRANSVGSKRVDEVKFVNMRVLVAMCGADFYKVDVETMKVMLEVKSSSIF